MTTLLFLLLLLLAALTAYRWHRAEREADYWLSQALFWERQAAFTIKANLDAEAECRRLYSESLRVVGRREALWEMVQEAKGN